MKYGVALLVLSAVVAAIYAQYPSSPLGCEYCGRLTLEKRRDCCERGAIECCRVAVPSDETYPGHAGGQYPGDYSGGPSANNGGYDTLPPQYPGSYRPTGGYRPVGYRPIGYPQGGYPNQGPYPGYPHGGYPNQGVYPGYPNQGVYPPGGYIPRGGPYDPVDPYGPADVILRKKPENETAPVDEDKDDRKLPIAVSVTTTEFPTKPRDLEEEDEN